ncbi:MipA/OmpV family protein [Acidovorax sp.]|uniref:MipA/OmpV family protein n=1 Tax=Acidovorax sp. TaxID=1872122 RepID=UPI00391FA787
MFKVQARWMYRLSRASLTLAGLLIVGAWCLSSRAHASQAVPAATDPSTTDAPLGEGAASTPAGSPAAFHYALGLLVTHGPDYAGGDRRKSGLSLAWAIEHGRFRVSSGRGSAFLGHGLRPVEPGASAILARSDRFNLSASLRVDRGRDDSAAPILTGLPPVRATLRGRLSAGYALTPRWIVGAGLSQDVLGRGGGAQMLTSLGYTWPLTQDTRVFFSAGASFADRTYLRSHFGVPAGGVGALPAFAPGAGLYSVDGGVEVMTALNRQWVVLAAVRASQLRGDARRSPLTMAPSGYSVSLGLAYRCCR